MLGGGVHRVAPASAVFEGMLARWALQQQTRFLKAATITSRLRLVRRVVEFSNEYPWGSDSDSLEAYVGSCRDGTKPIGGSTARLYEPSLLMFLQCVTDARYGWIGEC